MESFVTQRSEHVGDLSTELTQLVVSELRKEFVQFFQGQSHLEKLAYASIGCRSYEFGGIWSHYGLASRLQINAIEHLSAMRCLLHVHPSIQISIGLDPLQQPWVDDRIYAMAGNDIYLAAALDPNFSLAGCDTEAPELEDLEVHFCDDSDFVWLKPPNGITAKFEDSALLDAACKSCAKLTRFSFISRKLVLPRNIVGAAMTLAQAPALRRLYVDCDHAATMEQLTSCTFPNLSVFVGPSVCGYNSDGLAARLAMRMPNVIAFLCNLEPERSRDRRISASRASVFIGLMPMVRVLSLCMDDYTVFPRLETVLIDDYLDVYDTFIDGRYFLRLFKCAALKNIYSLKGPRGPESAVSEEWIKSEGITYMRVDPGYGESSPFLLLEGSAVMGSDLPVPAKGVEISVIGPDSHETVYTQSTVLATAAEISGGSFAATRDEYDVITRADDIKRLLIDDFKATDIIAAEKRMANIMRISDRLDIQGTRTDAARALARSMIHAPRAHE